MGKKVRDSVSGIAEDARVMLCHWASSSLTFRILPGLLDSEDEGNKFRRHVMNYWTNDIASQHRT
jgi:hypothetical protein